MSEARAVEAVRAGVLVFRAQARTEASKDDLRVIGVRSSEVSVVNQALNDGSEAGNLMLSPPALIFEATDDQPPSKGGVLRSLFGRRKG